MTPKLKDMPTGWTTDTSTTPRDHSCDIDKQTWWKRRIRRTHTRPICKRRLGGNGRRRRDAADGADGDHRVRPSVKPRDVPLRRSGARKSVQKSADSGVTVGEPKLSEVSFPKIGDASRVYRIEIPVVSAGTHASIYVDYLVYRVSRGLGLLAGVSEFDADRQLSVPRDRAEAGRARAVRRRADRLGRAEHRAVTLAQCPSCGAVVAALRPPSLIAPISRATRRPREGHFADFRVASGRFVTLSMGLNSRETAEM